MSKGWRLFENKRGFHAAPGTLPPRPGTLAIPPKGVPVNASPGLIAGATGTWGAFGLHQAQPAAAACLLWRHERRASLAAAHPVAPGLKSRRPNGRFLRRSTALDARQPSLRLLSQSWQSGRSGLSSASLPSAKCSNSSSPPSLSAGKWDKTPLPAHSPIFLSNLPLLRHV
jgi:hypothetical protein